MLTGPQDALPLPRKPLLILIIILFVILVVIREVSIFVRLVLFDVLLILLVFFVKIVGDGIQHDRVGLRYLELALTLRAAQDFSLFHFVFVHINFCATFWQRSTSPSSVLIFWRCRERGLHPPAYYIPQRGMSILGPFRHVSV